ncbi:MAG: glycosyltransferase family 4 protein [Flavobacteriales bacterium]
MARPLNIAHCVESYAPALGGMPEVVRQLSERMAAMGHGVTVFTSAHADRHRPELNGVTIRSFDVRGNLVQGLEGEVERYRNAVMTSAADVVVLFAAQQWATDALIPHLDTIPAKKVFVPTGFSALRDPAYAAYYERMPDVLRRMDLNVFLSHTYQDIAFARAHNVPAITVIPNGAAAEEFESAASYDIRNELGIAPAQRIILHLGSYTGIKGHREAIGMFLKADTADAVLVLIGNGNEKLGHLFDHHWRFTALRWQARLRRKRIVFLELDRSRTVSAMKQADLFLFPSQVECSPIVLFETLAAGVPFLASTAGNTQEIVEWTKGGWTMPGRTDASGRTHADLSAGAAMLSDLLRRPEAMRDAALSGQAAWKERFTWQTIAEQYLKEYMRLCNTNGGPR